MELLKTKTTPKQSPNSSFLCLKLPYYNPKKEITFLYKTIFPSQTFNNLKLHKTNSNSFSSTGIDFSNEHLKKCMEYQTNNSINIETPSIEPEIDEEEKFEAIKPKYHQNSITPVLTPRLPLNHNNTSTNHKGNNIPIGSCTSRIMKTITNFHKQTLNNADLNIVNYQLDKKSYLDEESNYNKYLNLYKQYNKEKLNKIKISNTNKLFYDVFFGNKSNTKYKEGFNDELIISNKLNKSCYSNRSNYIDNINSNNNINNNKHVKVVKVNQINLNNKTNFNIKSFKQHSFCYSLSSNVFPDSYYSINNSNCCSNKLIGGKITFRSNSSRTNNKDKAMKCLNKKKQNGNKLNVYEIDTKSIPNTSVRFNYGNSNSNYYNNLAYNVVIRSMKNYVNEKLGRLKLSNSFVTQTKYKEKEFITINNYNSSGKLINKKLFK